MAGGQLQPYSSPEAVPNPDVAVARAQTADPFRDSVCVLRRAPGVGWNWRLTKARKVEQVRGRKWFKCLRDWQKRGRRLSPAVAKQEAQVAGP